MRVRDIKQWIAPLRNTPLHPQWLLGGGLEARDLQKIVGITADVGCADQAVRHLLPESAQYIGLDYYETAVSWYESRPDVFADARQLPLADSSTDSALMLHLLEHLDRPGRALREATRILRPGGVLLIEVPFIYPIHDAPLDYRRWTREGIRIEIEDAGLLIDELVSIGRASETAAVLFNLAIARLTLGWLEQRSLWLTIAPLLWLLIPLLNIVGRALVPLQPNADFMPHRIRVLCRKPE